MTEDLNISDLLPDYLQGRLSHRDRQRVETALEKDKDLQAELVFLKSLSANLKSNADNYTPGELGWAKLSKAIDNDLDNAADNVPPIAVNDHQKSPSQFWRYAAVALAVVSVGQGALLMQKNASLEKDRYVTVSETSTVAVDSYKATIAFNPQTTEQDIRMVLGLTDGDITSGPSQLGLYTISFKSQDALAGALTIYASKPEIIESASTQ